MGNEPLAELDHVFVVLWRVELGAFLLLAVILSLLVYNSDSSFRCTLHMYLYTVRFMKLLFYLASANSFSLCSYMTIH